MTGVRNGVYEKAITEKAAKRADELGIEFKVQYYIKDGVSDIVFHIKRDQPIPHKYSSEEEANLYKESNRKLNSFTDFVSDIVVGRYAEKIKFTYPTAL